MIELNKTKTEGTMKPKLTRNITLVKLTRKIAKAIIIFTFYHNSYH